MQFVLFDLFFHFSPALPRRPSLYRKLMCASSPATEGTGLENKSPRFLEKKKKKKEPGWGAHPEFSVKK